MSLPFSILAVLLAVILFIVEFLIDRKEHKQLYKRKDTRNNILIGLGLFVVNLLNRGLNFYVFHFMYSFRIFSFGNTWITWITALILWDFAFYWYHRSAHSVNWFWASHSVHHSSDHFNLSTAFRQSWTQYIGGAFVFKLWLPILGFDPILISIVDNIGMGYQSWLHSELIKKVHPWFEWVFNTPSHHRVHHASDVKYLDKNHGGVFIIWDRIFGTFQKEEEKPTYGLTTKLESQDLTGIMWGDWKSLFAKAFSSGSVKNAIRYLVQSPGWSHNGSTKTVRQLRRELPHIEAA